MNSNQEEFKRYRDIGRSLLDKGYLTKSELTPHEEKVADLKLEEVSDAPREKNDLLNNLQKQQFSHYKPINREKSSFQSKPNQNQEHDDLYAGEEFNGSLLHRYSKIDTLSDTFDQLNISDRSDNNSVHFHNESFSSTHDDLERKRKELLRLNKSIDLVNKNLKEKEQKVLSKVDLDISQKPHSTYLTSIHNVSRYKYNNITTSCNCRYDHY